LVELEAAGRSGTALGVAVLTLAAWIDDLGGASAIGAGAPSLVKEHRAALEAALKDVESADGLDKIRERAALKLLAGGKRTG
jgi:hypothetical protein